MLKSSKRS